MGVPVPNVVKILLALSLAVVVIACDSDDEEATEEASVEQEETVEEVPEVAQPEVDLDELPFRATGPVARVDGREITADEFNQAVFEHVSRMPPQFSRQVTQAFVNQVLDFLIDRALVDAVLEEADIEVSDEELEAAFAEFRSRFPDDQTFAMYQAQLGMTEEVIRDAMRPDVALEKYLRDRYELEVTDEELTTYFEENREQFGEPPMADVKQIVIRVERDGSGEEEARSKIEAAHRELSEGAEFAQVATEYSEGPTAARGGELGPVPQGVLPDALDEAAFSLPIGELSEPIRSPFGYHILQISSRTEGQEVTLAEVRDEVAMRVRHRQTAEVFQRFMDEMKAEVEIEKIRDNIQVQAQAATPEPPAMPRLELTPPMGGSQGAGGSRPGGSEGEMQLRLDPNLVPQQ